MSKENGDGTNSSICLKCNSGTVKFNTEGWGRCNVCGQTVVKDVRTREPSPVSYQEASKRIDELMKLANARKEEEKAEAAQQEKKVEGHGAVAQFEEQKSPKQEEKEASVVTGTRYLPIIVISTEDNSADLQQMEGVRNEPKTRTFGLLNDYTQKNPLKAAEDIRRALVRLGFGSDALVNQAVRNCQDYEKEAHWMPLFGGRLSPPLEAAITYLTLRQEGIFMRQLSLWRAFSNQDTVDVTRENGSHITLHLKKAYNKYVRQLLLEESADLQGQTTESEPAEIGVKSKNKEGIMKLVEMMFRNITITEWRERTKELVSRLDLSKVRGELDLSDRMAIAVGAAYETIGGRPNNKLTTLSKNTGLQPDDILKGVKFIRRRTPRALVKAQ